MQISNQHQDFVSRLLSDSNLRSRMLAEPARVLEEQGISVPSGAELRVVEDSADVCHVILPPSPNTTLADSSMEAVAGGASTLLPLPPMIGVAMIATGVGQASQSALGGVAGS